MPEVAKYAEGIEVRSPVQVGPWILHNGSARQSKSNSAIVDMSVYG